MSKFVVLLALLAVSSASAVQDPFQDAQDVARKIISAELEGPFCKPAPIPAVQRQAMVKALAPLDRAGLTDSTGLGPLDLAVISDDVPTIERIVALGYSLKPSEATLLQSAAFHNSRHALSHLLNQGVNPDSENSAGATPLMSAAANGRLEVVQTLLAAGASPNAKTHEGGTALHYALGCKDQAMVDLLLASGADIDPEAQSLAERRGIILTGHER